MIDRLQTMARDAECVLDDEPAMGPTHAQMQSCNNAACGCRKFQPLRRRWPERHLGTDSSAGFSITWLRTTAGLVNNWFAPALSMVSGEQLDTGRRQLLRILILTTRVERCSPKSLMLEVRRSRGLMHARPELPFSRPWMEWSQSPESTTLSNVLETLFRLPATLEPGRDGTSSALIG